MFHQIAIFVHHVELEMGHLAVKLPPFCTIVVTDNLFFQGLN